MFVLIAGLTFVNAIILTNGLGAAGRGAVATAYGATIVFGWAFQFGLPASAAYYAKDLDHRDILNAAWRMCVIGAIPFALLLTPFYLWQFNGIAFEEGGQSLKLWYLAFVAVHILQSPFQSAVFYLRGVGSTVMFNSVARSTTTAHHTRLRRVVPDRQSHGHVGPRVDDDHDDFGLGHRPDRLRFVAVVWRQERTLRRRSAAMPCVRGWEASRSSSVCGSIRCCWSDSST